METVEPGASPGGDETFSRRVVAVLLADVTGYSALMAEDDERTAHAIGELREFVRRIVTDTRGHAEEFAGDAILATFDSVAAAVAAAIEIQTKIGATRFAELQLRLRIGVHFGDILQGVGGAHGDAINVASRLQQLARPGTVCVSDGVYRQVRHKTADPVVDLGRQRFKNISDPVRAYLILPGAAVGDGPTVRRRARVAAISAIVLGGILLVGLVSWRVVAERITGDRDSAEATAPLADDARVVALGVMVFRELGGNGGHAWVKEALRDGLNTQLSALSRVKVYSKEFIDFLVTRQGLSEIEVANRLGITKMLTGSYVAVGGTLKIDTHLVDVSSGVIEASYATSGPEESFLDLQNDLAMGIVAQLELELTEEDRAALLARSATDMEALRLLLEAEGAAAEMPAAGARTTPEPESTSRWIEWPIGPRAAFGAEHGGDELAIHAMLERYRVAMQDGSVEALVDLYSELSAEQRSAQERYFANVDKLRVEIADVDLVVVGDEAVVSYTRRDDFVDRRTGRPMAIAVRLTKTLVREGDAWKLTPGD